MTLRLDKVSCEYDDLPLFQAISATLESGDIVHIRGKNGQGKTTLMRTVAGLRAPSDGHVFWQGHDIYDSKTCHYQPCYIGHNNAVNHRLTARENLLFSTIACRKRASIEEGLEATGLLACADLLVDELSTGQRRRLALSRLFIVDSPLWILDEPFVALDDVSVTRFSRAVGEFTDRGGMVLLSSHQSLPLATECYRDIQLQ